MKQRTLLILIALLCLGTAYAQNAEDSWFERANAAYAANNYDSALVLYEKILASEMESAPLYYNMGNTYYKKHEYPMAIYCYEKALKLDPSNEEVKTNLAIANKAIVDKIDPVPQSFITKGWQRVRAWLSSDLWAWCSVVAFAVFLGGLMLFLCSRRVGLRKLGFFAGAISMVKFALSVVFSVQLKQAAMTQDQAIIMAPTVTVKSSPSETGIDLFVLHEGSKVSILETTEGWNKVKIANGSVGWLQENCMRSF